MQPKALLLGLNTPSQSGNLNVEDSVLELKELARTAEINVVQRLIQTRTHPDPKWYVGSGKIEEIKELIKEHSLNLVITDDELTPSQHKHIEEALNVKVIDRTGLILDIFADRASTHEAKLQVELAQLNYLLPRLTRLWTHLSRQTGGIGTKGPGETQLEVDKRRINERISTIKEKLIKVKNHRNIQRHQRKQKPAIMGAIMGYTNAGKSTLLNALTEANILAEDKLFATLDPTTKKLKLDSNDDVVLTDTVGFIQKLPHQLIKAFHSTLEEVILADFILHVVDVSSKDYQIHIKTAQEIIKELKGEEIPQIMVFNKMDRIKDPLLLKSRIKPYAPCVAISAKEGLHLDELKKTIIQELATFRKIMTFTIPYSKMDIKHLLHQNGTILSEEFGEKEITLEVNINQVIGHKIMNSLYRDR